jgi:predicted ATPase
VGLRTAWDRRGRFKELRTRGADGPIEIEIKYRETPAASVFTYHLSISEDIKGPYIAEEWLKGQRGKLGPHLNLIEFKSGSGVIAILDEKDLKIKKNSSKEPQKIKEKLDSREMLAVNTLGQFAKHPRVSALRRFIADWYLSYLSADNARGAPEAGPQERLSATGDNLANVIQYLKEQHEVLLDNILRVLSTRIPRLERVDADLMADGRLLLQVKDAPFERPVLAKFASDGTLKMLAYLTVLYDPSPPQLIGIEEPENQLHPRLLRELAEECRKSAARTQLMVTTHSPFFVNGLRPDEVWVLYRNEQGYTEARRTADMQGVLEQIAAGGQLGDLWMEGFFEVGNPLLFSGGPNPESRTKSPRKKKTQE